MTPFGFAILWVMLLVCCAVTGNFISGAVMFVVIFILPAIIFVALER